jgi:renalase
MAQKNTRTCLIIGAGMSGLMAALKLQESGIQSILIDKGRSVGGRMATRRIDSALFDHGAQFFTIRTDLFRSYVDEWIQNGLVREWSRKFQGDSGDEYPRYIGSTGMNSIAKHLSRDLNIILNEQVLFLNHQDNKWHILTNRENSYTGDALILTPPVPQTIALIQSGNLQDDKRFADELEYIKYDSCLALMALIDPPAPFAKPGALKLSGEPITWIADNQIKGISSNGPAVTIHAGPEFSRKYWEMDEKTITQNMVYIASDWLKTKFKSYQLKKWRYSQPVVVHEKRTVFFKEPLPIALAGDAFGGQRIEGAALSGLAAAEAIAEFLK